MNEAPRSVIVAAEDQTRLRRSLPRRLWRVPVVVAAATLLLVIGAGTAWAYLTATGTGSGTATVHFTSAISTTSLTLSRSSITHGQSGTTVMVTGTVTGATTKGNPKKGAVTIKATGVTLCGKLSLTPSGTDAATFSCTITPTQLAAGSYEVRAYYSGGQSSNTNYEYTPSTSFTEPLTVSS